MAGFEGIRWAETQLVHDLVTSESRVVGADDAVVAVSRSIHYGLCLAFEGIRFQVRMVDGQPRFTFLNLHLNIDRFRRSIAFNLAPEDEGLVPSAEALQTLFVQYLQLDQNASLIRSMAQTGQQGYLRPFTVDEQQSIGVTFPKKPVIRVVCAGYDGYLGEPFEGVVIPQLVRAVGVNNTGCLKLGVNYLISVRAIAEAQKVVPGAGAALFLDDRPDRPVDDRLITEWDSSCALIALRDGTFIRIPDGPLILPSVTIGGVSDILRMKGYTVNERQVSFRELVELDRSGDLVAVASIGTAGVLNRCAALHLFDGREVRSVARADVDHPGYAALGDARAHYLSIFRHQAEVPEGHSKIEV